MQFEMQGNAWCSAGVIALSGVGTTLDWQLSDERASSERLASLDVLIFARQDGEQRTRSARTPAERYAVSHSDIPCGREACLHGARGSNHHHWALSSIPAQPCALHKDHLSSGVGPECEAALSSDGLVCCRWTVEHMQVQREAALRCMHRRCRLGPPITIWAS